MRLITKLGILALAVMTTMALGVASASATSTQLCGEHTGLTCSFTRSFINQLNVGVVKLLSAITVLCLHVKVLATALGLGSPQQLHTTEFSFENCGSGSLHNNCTITVEEMPLSNLLKTGLDEGVLTATNGRMRLVCSNLGIDCVYDLEGIEFSVGAGHLTAEQTPTTELGGKFLCPDEGYLDGLLEMTLITYVLG